MSVATTPWFDDFERELEERCEEWDGERQTDKESKRATQDAELECRAAKLAEHAAFNVHPVSFQKRRLLASRLFPDESPDVVDRMTDHAEKLSWLKRAAPAGTLPSKRPR